MKNRFDHVVPETPASFHDSLERALRATAERERRSVRLRPAALIAAALAGGGRDNATVIVCRILGK